MSSLFQFQIDIVKGVTLSAKNADRLFKDCTEDDIQALVFPPVELFGQWLMVAGERTRQGGTALEAQQPSWLRVPVRTSIPSITRTIAKSVHLTSSFLFAICCTIGFDPQRSGELIHEMMGLKGYLTMYPIPSRLVCEFVEILNGCRDFIPAPTPFDVYDTIAEGVWSENNKQQLKIDNYYNDCDNKGLANLLVQILDTLQDTSCRHICLEGSKTGIWLASVFAWLRPEETAVFVNEEQIYPLSQSQRGNGPRLLICFRGSQDRLDDGWKISEWREVDSPAETFTFHHIGGNDMDIPRQHPSPWRDAKYQLEMRETPLVPNDIGHLAAALIDTVVENGILWTDDETTSIKLKDICSRYSLHGYPAIMAKFGWHDLNPVRTENMASALESRLDYLDSRDLQEEGYVSILGKMIEACYEEYEHSHHEPLLLSLNNHTRDTEIIEHAINLAGQAIMSSLWLQLPKNPIFWPPKQGLLNEFSKLIVEVLAQGLASKCSFWKLRQRSFLPIIPTADANPLDLACSGGGYVAYTAILSAQDENMTDQRLAGCIQIRPGCLKWQGVQGRYTRLVQETLNLKLANRVLDVQERQVELFTEQGTLNGIPEIASQNKLDISIVHSIRSDYVKKTLYLRTHLEEQLPQGSLISKVAIPTQWRRSIDVVLSANHVTEVISRLEQLGCLAEDWKGKGRLSGALQWCYIGKIPKPGIRYIATTRANTELRVFEAGNVSDRRKVVIRQGLVQLLQCVKVAMEECGDDPEWVIIA